MIKQIEILYHLSGEATGEGPRSLTVPEMTRLWVKSKSDTFVVDGQERMETMLLMGMLRDLASDGLIGIHAFGMKVEEYGVCNLTFKGEELIKQLIGPSQEIDFKYRRK